MVGATLQVPVYLLRVAPPRSVAHRVAMCMVTQWRENAIAKGLSPQPAQLTSAYNKFVVSALQLGKQAVRGCAARVATGPLAGCVHHPQPLTLPTAWALLTPLPDPM